MSLLVALWVFMSGLIVGSFINALSFRWGTGRKIALTRSACMRCGHVLRANDLIPLVSYFYLKGKCRYCSSKISVQYPLVESVGGMLALGVYITNGLTLLGGFWFLVWMILLFVAVYDVRHTVIPWACSLLICVLGLILALCVYIQSGSIEGLVTGPLLATPLLLLHFLSKGKWMGLGDGVLELGLAWLVGSALSFMSAFTALLYAFWGGAFIGIASVLVSHILSSSYLWHKVRTPITIKSEIPFAPFLIGGVAVIYFFNVDIFSSIGFL